MMRITITIVFAFSVASCITAQTLSIVAPRAGLDRTAQNLSLAIAIYSSGKNVQRASSLVREIEKDLGPPSADWRWDDTPMSATDALQKARYALVAVEHFEIAKRQWNKFSRDEQFALEETGADRYQCAARDRRGNYVGIVVDRCIKNALSKAKANRDLAVEFLR